MKGFISKLGRIQRQASLHITGTMMTAPMDIIDTCVDLLPFHLLVEKLTHHAVTHLAMLPRSHPLEAHVWKAASRYVKRHRMLPHEIFHTFRIWPGDYEDIEPMQAGTECKPCYMTHIPM